MFREDNCFLSHSCCCRGNKWCEGRVFNFPYSLFIDTLLFRFMSPITGWGFMFLLEGAWRLKTLTSKSLVTACSSGSRHTLLQTLVRSVAVKLCISLCLMLGKPPFEQENACSSEKLLPQSHLDAILVGVQPYLSANASWKALLCKENLCSISGKGVSQVAPVSLPGPRLSVSCPKRDDGVCLHFPCSSVHSVSSLWLCSQNFGRDIKATILVLKQDMFFKGSWNK